MDFTLTSAYSPTGDQPEAIAGLVNALNKGVPYSTLLGVTGSGKTFTMANVIAQTKRPALVLSHNKTLAAQLYGEFKAFFPENAVEYFVFVGIVANNSVHCRLCILSHLQCY